MLRPRPERQTVRAVHARDLVGAAQEFAAVAQGGEDLGVDARRDGVAALAARAAQVVLARVGFG